MLKQRQLKDIKGSSSGLVKSGTARASSLGKPNNAVNKDFTVDAEIQDPLGSDPLWRRISRRKSMEPARGCCEDGGAENALLTSNPTLPRNAGKKPDNY